MTTAEILEEGISDAVLKRAVSNRTLASILDAAKIAIPCVLRAAAAGNVQCREAAAQILLLLKSL